jgi:hypothetical protein
MPNLLVAGNSTNGGTAISTDTSGTLNIVTGSGSGVTAMSIDASQVVTIPGNLTVSGTLSASGGVSGGIRSGTAVASTSGTSIDFTSLPTGIKRITVMFSGVSTNGTSQTQIQLGDAGGFETSGYVGTTGYNSSYVNYSSGFTFDTASSVSAATVRYGAMILNYVGSNMWVVCGTGGTGGSAVFYFGGAKTLSDTLTQVRITTVNGTDTFDNGTINILYE